MERKELEKMTVTKLRQEALKISGLQGVHSMKKPQLIEALLQVFREEESAGGAGSTASLAVSEMKRKMRSMRGKMEEARPRATRKQLQIFRRKIKRLRRQSRKISVAQRDA